MIKPIRSVVPGSEVDVSGAGFWGHEEAKVYFGHSLQFFVTADDQGKFWGVGFTVHANGPGVKMVTAVGQKSGRSAQTQFMIHTTWPGFGPTASTQETGRRSVGRQISVMGGPGNGSRKRPDRSRVRGHHTNVDNALAGATALVGAAGPAAAATPGQSAHAAQPMVTAASCTITDGRADAACTPGAFNPDVTQSTIGSTICVSGWTSTVRPSATYTTKLKNQQKLAYGEVNIPNSELEEDHLVPLELGGAPRDPNNLWPEPRASAATTSGGRAAENKDREENALKKQVCAGQITLARARQQIITDWTHN